VAVGTIAASAWVGWREVQSRVKSRGQSGPYKTRIPRVLERAHDLRGRPARQARRDGGMLVGVGAEHRVGGHGGRLHRYGEGRGGGGGGGDGDGGGDEDGGGGGGVRRGGA
ncbi:hypothetical protein C8R45DRAFT_937924, partial [Mycena sanguinolenta]